MAVVFLNINSVISIPFPTTRLASSALRALQVDQELSSLVQRAFSLTADTSSQDLSKSDQKESTILRTEYRATTNRMLRVAVNGFMESLGVVLGVMEELDIDVLPAYQKKGS
jgi:EKC/KEOPS complex subunit PCC1/LAGE3